jgi:hypothetical protein
LPFGKLRNDPDLVALFEKTIAEAAAVVARAASACRRIGRCSGYAIFRWR